MALPLKSKLRGDPNTPIGSFGRTMLRGFVQEHIAVADVFQTCLTCLSFRAGDYYCNRWKDKVPASVIVAGCREYADVEEIPF